MTTSIFFICLILITVAYFAREFITHTINKIIEDKFHYTTFKIESSWVSYFLFFLTIWVLILGMFIDGKTQHSQMSVKESMENLKPVSKTPSRLFDINLDIFGF
jgi:hypothetical protein